MLRVVPAIVVLVLTLALAGVAEEKRPAEVPGDLLFTAANGQPLPLERLHPGVTAALRLTEDQKAALGEARERAVRALQGIPRKPATPEQRAEARRASEAARVQLLDAVAKTLTAEQKTLVSRIQGAYDESQRVSKEKLAPEFKAATGD